MTKQLFRAFATATKPLLKSLSWSFTKGQVWFVGAAAADYRDLFLHLAKHHGRLYACKVVKEIALSVKVVSLKGPVRSRASKGKRKRHPYGIHWLRLDAYGIPCRLWRLSRLARSRRTWSKRCANTIANLYKVVECRPEPSIGHRLDKAPGSMDPRFRRALVELDLKYHLSRIRPKVEAMFDNGFWLGTAGPNGGKSVFNVRKDAKALYFPEHRPVLDACKGLLDALRDRLPPRRRNSIPNGYLWEYALQEFGDQHPDKKPDLPWKRSALSRLIFISEGGGKTRGVTPVNYHIQKLLRPLHNRYMQILKMIPQDCSYDEAKGVAGVMKMTSHPLYTGSGFDFTDFTDLIPARLLYQVVEYFDGKRAAACYLRLMKLPVEFKAAGKAGRFPYGAGAPMGIYCLWPVAALAHHALVQLAANPKVDGGGASKPFTHYPHYYLRGDDVVLFHNSVVQSHRAQCTSLGMIFSEGKSIGSSHAKGAAEFAKQTILRGRVVSGIQSGKLYQAGYLDPLLWLDLLPQLTSLSKDPSRTGQGATLKSVCRDLFPSTRSGIKKATLLESQAGLPWHHDRLMEPWKTLTLDTAEFATLVATQVRMIKQSKNAIADMMRGLVVDVACTAINDDMVNVVLSAAEEYVWRLLNTRELAKEVKKARSTFRRVPGTMDLGGRLIHPVIVRMERVLKTLSRYTDAAFGLGTPFYELGEAVRVIAELRELTLAARGFTRRRRRLYSMRKYSRELWAEVRVAPRYISRPRDKGTLFAWSLYTTGPKDRYG